MSKAMVRCALLTLALMPSMATAAPIELKFSFFTSDRSNIYQNTIKPFVDAVNDEGKGLIEIKMYFSGAISADASPAAAIGRRRYGGYGDHRAGAIA